MEQNISASDNYSDSVAVDIDSGGGAAAFIFVLLYGLVFAVGTPLNTILLIVFIRRPSFRIYLSNRYLVFSD